MSRSNRVRTVWIEGRTINSRQGVGKADAGQSTPERVPGTVMEVSNRARKSECLRVARRGRQQAVLVAGQVRVTRGNNAYETDRRLKMSGLVTWAVTTHVVLLLLPFSLSKSTSGTYWALVRSCGGWSVFAEFRWGPPPRASIEGCSRRPKLIPWRVATECRSRVNR
jgi:hypothetical protein